MSDLFDAAPRTGSMPLAAELRPATLDDVIGQEKVIGPGTMLRRRIAAGRLGSIILYGPPGLGKTSIARAIGNMLGKTSGRSTPRTTMSPTSGKSPTRRACDRPCFLRTRCIVSARRSRITCSRSARRVSPTSSARRPATPTTR